MPYLKTYDLFISHSWRYGVEYKRMVDLLNNAPYFYWRNYSSPKHHPAISPNSEYGRNKLIAALRNQIRPVNCVLILSGLYAAYSYWIQKEIALARSYRKPIIGVRPWGSTRIPQVVQNSADEIVGWNISSVLGAIRRDSI